MWRLETKVSKVQVQEFLNNPCTAFVMSAAAEKFKDAIVNCSPDEIDKREHAYFMYHAVKSLESEISKMAFDINAKEYEISLDNQ